MAENPPGAIVGRKQRLLLLVERFSRRRYAAVLLTSVVLLVGSSWLGSKIALESDVLKLIPQGNRLVDTFRQALTDFGAIDYLMIVLEADDATGPDELEEVSDLLADKLQAETDLVESVEYRFRADERFAELFSENALLFLPPDELPAIAAKLTDEAIRRQVEENRSALASPAGALTEGLVLQDPLGLMPLFVDRLLSHRGALKLDLTSGYYLSTDGRALIMLVKPKHPSQDLAYSRRLLAAAEVAAGRARDELAEEGGAHRGVRVRYGGNPATLVEEAALLGRTVAVTGIASFFAVIGLYLVCYRRLATLFYSSYPLMLGQAVTFAIAYFALGGLNSASAALPALLMGLGTDFTIVMYARYVEERRAGKSLADATEAMVGEGGLGVFTGAITSAGTFYALCVSGYRGLFDLGFLIGTGILVCAVAIVFLLPAMIKWNEGVRRRRDDSMKKLHLQSLGLEHLMPWSARHGRTVVVGIVLLTVVAGWLAWGLDFDDSINSLRSPESESYQVQQEVAEKFGASLSYMMAISEGPTLNEAVALAATVRSRLQPFLEDGTIGRYESILDYVPPEEQQARVIAALDGGPGGAFDAARIGGTFVAALDDSGFRPEAFDGYLRRMERFLTPDQPITLVDLENRGLGRLVDRYVKRQPDRVRIVTYLYPTDPRWKRTPPPGLVESLTGRNEGISVTGTNVVSRELRGVFVRDSLRAVLLGLGLVAVLLLVDFRSLRLTGIALAQLVTGVVMMMGCMRLLGLEINYANAFVATMIMGVGIDYSIHLVHRLHRNGGRVDEGLLETGKGVVLAAATNVAGFGTLMLGNYPAMRSVGVVALMGSVTCLITSLTLVPALMARDADDGVRP